MTRYRDALPQLNGDLFLTDGGIETTLVFHHGFELPHFAAFHLLREPLGRTALADYYRTYATIARARGVGFVLESATWRASLDWGARLGYSNDELGAANRDAIALMEPIRDEFEAAGRPNVLSGCIGPRGDGYAVGAAMSPRQAQAYHAFQVETFAETAADMVTAITMTYADEATGLVRAASAAGLPVAVSFTVETDGRLPSGQALGEAIDAVDQATAGAPAYYMINCAHPTHFESTLDPDSGWVKRIRGLRANASTKSHAELDEATELDDGNPVELGADYARLRQKFPQLTVLGGCCGTDHRHIEVIGAACA